MSKSTLDTSINNAVLTGGRRTTAINVRAILHSMVAESYNVYDPTASGLLGTEMFPLIQSGVTKQVSLNNIAAFIGGGGGLPVILALDNTTNEQIISSNNGFATLAILDAKSEIYYADGVAQGKYSVSSFGAINTFSDGTNGGTIGINGTKSYIEHDLSINFTAPIYNFYGVTPSTYAYFDGSGNLISGATPGATSLDAVLAIGNLTNELEISSNNGRSILKVWNGYSELRFTNGGVSNAYYVSQYDVRSNFDNGVNAGEVHIYDTSLDINHSAQILSSAPTNAMGTTDGYSQVNISNGSKGVFSVSDATFVQSEEINLQLNDLKITHTGAIETGQIRIRDTSNYISHSVKIIYDSPIYEFTQLSASTIVYLNASKDLISLSAGTNGQVLTLAGGLPTWATATGGTVTAVSGTTNRITSTGGTTPVIDISASYVGQSSITTLGTIGAGTWNGTSISTTYTDAKIKTVTGTSNRITIGGTSTDPTFDISTSYVGQATITTLGTITTGTWNGTAISNGNLANSSITIGSTAISLGATSTTLAGLTSVTSTTFVGALTGNASTATALQTGRTINGTTFDGTANITITAAAGTLTGTTLNATVVTSSLTSVGTITTGVWTGTAIADTYISSSTNWNTAYTNRITSLTTTGSSGASTLSSNTLNIPNYTLSGLGGTTLAAVNAQNLSVFASTTSAQFAGVISDETGYSSGAVVVFSKAPTIDSPIFSTLINGSYLTASQILGTDASKNIVSLSTATYPSLTELSYLKGLPSAISPYVQNSTDKYAVATGTDTYAITLSPAPTAYATGQIFHVKIPNTNATTTPSLNVNGLGAKTIVAVNGVAIPIGQLYANDNYYFLYDGTNFVLQAGLMDRKDFSYYRKYGTTTLEKWYGAATVGFVAATVAIAKDILRATPFVVSKTSTLDRIAMEITTGGFAASVVRLAIYDDVNGVPTNLILDAGTIAGDSATFQAITINQVLTPGLYWLVFNHNSITSITFRSCSRDCISQINGYPTALGTTAGNSSGVTSTLVYTTMPSTFTTTGMAVSFALTQAIVSVRLSA